MNLLLRFTFILVSMLSTGYLAGLGLANLLGNDFYVLIGVFIPLPLFWYGSKEMIKLIDEKVKSRITSVKSTSNLVDNLDVYGIILDM